MKKTLFNIDETEKQRILEMHISEIKKQLGEQAAPAQTPKLQTTQFAPQNFQTVNLVSGAEAEILKDGKPVMWTISPSQSKTKDQKGNLIPVPGKLRLDITAEGIPNTRTALEIDCKSKGVNFLGSISKGDYSNITFKYMNRDYTGNEGAYSAKNLITQALGTVNDRGKWTYTGPIKEMGDKFCQSV